MCLNKIMIIVYSKLINLIQPAGMMYDDFTWTCKELLIDRWAWGLGEFAIYEFVGFSYISGIANFTFLS